jgi:hypothetical protein
VVWILFASCGVGSEFPPNSCLPASIVASTRPAAGHRGLYIIIPEKIGQQHFSRHSVISDAFSMLESEQEEETRKKADEQLNAAEDKLKRSQKALNEAEERLRAAL